MKWQRITEKMAEGSPLSGYDSYSYRQLVAPQFVLVHMYCTFYFVSYQNWMLLEVHQDINEMGN